MIEKKDLSPIIKKHLEIERMEEIDKLNKTWWKDMDHTRNTALRIIEQVLIKMKYSKGNTDDARNHALNIIEETVTKLDTKTKDAIEKLLEESEKINKRYKNIQVGKLEIELK